MDKFDFGSIVAALGKNPFGKEEKSSDVDNRFYKLTRDAEGNGNAIVSFFPDTESQISVKMLRLNTTIERNGQKRWISAYSPSTIGLPCPFVETYKQNYNVDPTQAKKFRPAEKYIFNIKVIKDSANPANEGKMFLYEMSKTLAEKVISMVTVDEQQAAMGIGPKEIFNPLSGWVFNLKCFKKKENGITSYDNSEFVQLPNGRTIYSNMEGDPVTLREEDLKKTYKLSDLCKPEAFMSYATLKEKLEEICRGLFGIGVDSSKPAQPQVQEPVPAQTSDINITVGTQPTPPTSAPQTSQPKNDLDSLLNAL